jgi:two-component system LytT family sensor kinase
MRRRGNVTNHYNDPKQRDASRFLGAATKMVEQNLVILLVKLAVAASLASVLTRSGRFQRMLMREERTLAQRVQMALVCAFIFGAGVAGRVVTKDAYLDLGMEGSLVLGLLGGYVTGLLSGVLISLPAMFAGESLTIILFAAVGLMGALLRDIAPDKEAIWKFSPFPDHSLWRLLWRRDLRLPAFSLACVLVILLAELLRSGLATLFEQRGPFSLQREWVNSPPLMIVAIYACTVFAVVLPIKVWNSNRNEKKLEQQQLHLNEARMDALSRQINPHFLFNTLNSVAALIRSDPPKARQVVYNLSHILRRLLRNQENLAPLREELAFIDDYLAIEKVRFGEKLRVVKEIEPATLDRLVPSMLLQPIVENSIRHGLSSKVGGGTIRIRSSLGNGRLLILVEDDGAGIPETKLANLFQQGIGVSNVNERLKVLFGDDYKMWIDSGPGGGTSTGIELPDQATSNAATRVESLAAR